MAKRRKQRKPGGTSGPAARTGKDATALSRASESRPTLLRRWQVPLGALTLLVAALWVYAPALHGDWLWDDDTLVWQNTDLRSLAGLGRIWSGHIALDYWPLTWTLFWIEWQLWGGHVLGYHLVTLALHAGCGLVVWRILVRLGLRWGWLGGLIFLLHPLAVESVAWIAETKNTLSLFLLLLSFDLWLTDSDRRQIRVASIALFLAAMLAKTSVVMFPAVLLFHAWWKRGRVTWRDAARIAPYLAIAAVFGLIDAHGQGTAHAAIGSGGHSLLATITSAGEVVFFYAGKFLDPLALSPIYPAWPIDRPSAWQWAAVPLLAVIFAVLVRWRTGWARHVVFGLGWYALNLVPVLGLVGSAFMGVTRVADHLAYISLAGLAGLAALGLQALHDGLSRRWRGSTVGVATLVVALLALQAHAYAGWFAGPEALWTHTLQLNPRAGPAYVGLGTHRAMQGDLAGAIQLFRQAVDLGLQNDVLYSDLGHALLLTGKLTEAEQDLTAALNLNPQLANATLDRAACELVTGPPAQAEADARTFLALAPGDANAAYAQLWLWIALAQQARPADSQAIFGTTDAHPPRAGQDPWPHQIALYVLGQIDQSALLAAARSGVPATDRRHQAEAWFYIGEKELLAGDNASARDAFQKAKDAGATEVIEASLAQAELTNFAASP